jgi:hypothetical protein
MNSAPSELIQSSLNNKKIEFERKREEKVEGILLRSKANWHENGEKCSQYFCKLEKKNFIKKTITELIDDAGHHISDQSKILLQHHDFYRSIVSIFLHFHASLPLIEEVYPLPFPPFSFQTLFFYYLKTHNQMHIILPSFI